MSNDDYLYFLNNYKNLNLKFSLKYENSDDKKMRKKFKK